MALVQSFSCSLVLAAFCVTAPMLRVSAEEANFLGTLELLPPGCEKTPRCQLGAEFGFVDSAGLGWQARKGLLTDGASIPLWAQPLVGGPFEKAFIKAAVIHDHYCDRRVRPWRQTHKVFYEALLKSEVPKGKAGIMYFAVMVGGPKWAKLVKGIPCPVGVGCINSAEVSAAIPGGAIALGETREMFVSRGDAYGSARFANLMAQNVPALEQAGDTLTAAEVEVLAVRAMGEDFYFKNDNEVGTNLDITVQ
jgi:hypothetical protein